MKGSQIKIGEKYIARVSGKLVRVHVLGKSERHIGQGRWRDTWEVVNTATGRRLTFRSPQKFRFAVGSAAESAQ